jgi:hypothetical protein
MRTILFILAVFTMIAGAFGQVQIEGKPNVEGRIKTIYDSNGKPVNQSEDAKGWHQVTDSVELTSGRAIINLNTSTIDGNQDVSFKSFKTYHGQAWSTDSNNVYTYRIVPLTGSRFQIRSSGAGDSSWVQYKVEGE